MMDGILYLLPLEAVVSLPSRPSPFALLLTLHLAPVAELGMSDLLVDPSCEYIQVKELVLGTCVPELHGAKMGVSSILDVLAKKILCRGTVKNELSSAVMRLVTRMEEAIMLKGILFLNDLIVFLLHCPAVIGQALLKLLEADTVELR